MTRKNTPFFERVKSKITGIPNDLKDLVNYFTKPNIFKSRFMQSVPGSLTLIFSVTTTLTGSTLLTMPFGFQQSGLIIGNIIFVVEAFLSFYTCYLIMKHSISHRQVLVEDKFEEFKNQAQTNKAQHSKEAEQNDELNIQPAAPTGDNYQSNPNLNLNINLLNANSQSSPRISLEIPQSTTPLGSLSPSTPRAMTPSDSEAEKSILREFTSASDFRFDAVKNPKSKITQILHKWIPFAFVCCCIPKKWRITKIQFPKVVSPNDLTYPHIMKMYFGPWIDALSLFVSVFILIGASIAYHIFLKDSLMSLVSIFFSHPKDEPDPWYWCPPTVSLYIIIALFPLISLKDVGIIKKINSFGFIFLVTNLSVMILLSVQMFLESYGIYFPFLELLSEPEQPKTATTSIAIVNLRDGETQPQKKNLFALMGILSLSFFIHNIISQFVTDAKVEEVKKKLKGPKGNASFTEQEFYENYFTEESNPSSKKSKTAYATLPETQTSQKKPAAIPLQSNPHVMVDVGIAFFFAAILYFVPGIFGSVAYTFKYEINAKPGMKIEKMQGNFLNLFSSRNILAIISRACVFLQLGSIYPLLCSVVRDQIFVSILGKVPSFIGFHFMINIVIATITTLFAGFYPNVGAVLSYTGAFCGLFWLYLFPVGIELLSQIVDRSLPWYIFIFWAFFNIIVASFGFVILIAQFLPNF